MPERADRPRVRAAQPHLLPQCHDGGDCQSSPANTVASRRKWSTAYADCSGSYFGAMADALLAQRDAYVERNRETLTAFAEDLAAAGYVP